MTDKQGNGRTKNGRRRRLLILTKEFRPEPNFITGDVADALVAHMDVVVVTAHPNYPFGRFYDGTRYWWPSRSIEKGVIVWRLPFYPDKSLSLWRRALSYLSFALAAALFSPFVAGKPDTVWVYHGPFTTGLAALWFRLVYRSRVVITAADLWPESFAAAGVASHGVLLRMMYAYSRAVNRMADLIVCCTRGTLDRYRRDGIPEQRLCYVPVWTTTSAPPEPVAEMRRETARLVYAGNMGPAQNLETLIRAAAELEKRDLPVAVHLYGTGTREAELKKLAQRLNASNVIFHGAVAPAIAFHACASSFAQVVLLRRSPLFRMTVPSKLYFSFAAGAPLLCGLEGEAAELAAESGGAIPFESDDAQSLVDAVAHLMRLDDSERARMRQRLHAFYQNNFAPHSLLRAYEEILAGIVTRTVPAIAEREQRVAVRQVS